MRYPYEPSLDYYDGRQGVLPDLRFSENQQNRGFAMPGGFNSNNPIFNMLGSMILSSSAGIPMESLGPLQGYSGTDSAFINASQRQSEYRKTRQNLINNAPGLRMFGSDTASNSLFQEAYNMSGAGGGNMDQAYQTAVNRFSSSTRLGYGIRDQSRVAENLVRGISDAYTVRDDKKNISNGYEGNPLYYSKEKSFGFDVKDSLRNLDVMRRAGVTGFGTKDIQEATAPGADGKLANPEKLMKLSKESNEFMRIAKQTFGEDLDPTQLIDLMDKATDGLSKISGSKASEFAAKVQATAASLDISGKAFAQYMAMQQNSLRSMGVTGQASTTAIMNSAIAAKSLQDRAQSTGNTKFSDTNNAMDAAAAVMNDYAGSEDFQASRAAVRIIGDKSDKDRLTQKIGGRNLNEFLEGMKAAQKSGNIEEVERYNEEAQAAFGDHEMWRAKNMDDEAGAKAERRAGINTGEFLTGGAGAKRILSEFLDSATEETGGQEVSEFLGKRNLKQADILKGLDSNQLQDQDEIAKKLESAGVSDKDEREHIAATMAHANKNVFAGMKSNNPENYTKNVAAISMANNNDFEKNQLAEKQRDKDAIKAQILASVMGDMGENKLTIGQALDAAGKGETFSKEIAKARGSNTVSEEDRKAGWKKAMGALADDPKLSKLKEAMIPGADGTSKMDHITDSIQAIKDNGFASHEKEEVTNKKVNEAMQASAKELGLDDPEKLNAVIEANKEKEKKGSDKASGKTKDGDVPGASGSSSASNAPIIDVKAIAEALQDSIGKTIIAKMDEAMKYIPENIKIYQIAPSKGLFC